MATIFHGADVSIFQGSINWTTYAANKDFVIIKAGGADGPGLYTDPNFSTNQNGARAAGLRIGYYFFGDRNVNSTSAANYFVSILGTLLHGEILVLDIEGANYPQDNWAFNFCSIVHANFGFYPFVYMSQFSPTSSTLAWTTTNPIAPFWMAHFGLSDTDFSETTGNADGTWGGLAAPNYRILQYADNGSIPGISHVVDLDSFYSPNNTLADWDALGFQGAGGQGILSNASVTNPTITFTQPEIQTIIVPEYSYDKVIFSDTVNITVSSSTWPKSVAGPVTNINQTAYPVGNFSFDGGATWNDFGFIFSTDFGSFYGQLPVWVIQPVVDSSGNLTFNISFPQGGNKTETFIVHIALLASHSPGVLPGTTNITQSTAFSNLVPNVNPPYATYRRISQDRALSVGGTYPHNLGTIPNLNFWQYDTSNETLIAPSVWSSTGGIAGTLGVAMDATNIYFHTDALTQDLFLRTYLDN